MKIYILSVMVDDQQKAETFYTDILGFVVDKDIPVGDDRWLTVRSPEQPDGIELLLEPNKLEAAQTFQKALFDQGMPSTSFAVDDVDQEHARLEALGVTFRHGPRDYGPVRAAVFDDTCGNWIQIVQLSASDA